MLTKFRDNVRICATYFHDVNTLFQDSSKYDDILGITEKIAETIVGTKFFTKHLVKESMNVDQN